MVEYSKPPPLDKLNPVQRYLQKGELETGDWFKLALLVIVYLLLRPWIEHLFKAPFNADPRKTSQEANKGGKSKAKVSPNAIRGAVDDTDEGAALEPYATTSGRDPTMGSGAFVTRRGKGGTSGSQRMEDTLLDWEDVPARKPVEGDKGDVVEWLGSWDEKI